MGTKNPRIAAYVPESIYSKFQSFKQEQQIGDSQALIRILSDYFGVTHLVSRDESLQALERIERLEASLSTMRSDLLDELKRVVLAELAPQAVMFAIPPSQMEANSVLPDPGVIEAAKVDEAPLVSEFFSVTDLAASDQVLGSQQSTIEANEVCLLSIELEKRLNASSSTMSKKKRSSFEVFAAWTAEKDPDGISWKVNNDGSVSPIGEIPPDVREMLKPKKIEGLSHGDLAKRLKIDKSTLTYWKKKPAEDLLRATRDKDPDGIGWVLNKETGRFAKESGSSPRMTQGELPTIGHPESDDF